MVWWKERRFQFGLAVTVIWLGIGLWMFFSFEHPKSLNEWGDFLAGVSAPLAFLWLVLGYLQQGEELRQSTQALSLQVLELKNSVVQQSQLVAVAREQIQHERQVSEENQAIRRQMARPRFTVFSRGYSAPAGQPFHELAMTNFGSTATSVKLDFVPGVQSPKHIEYPVIAEGTTVEFSVMFGNEDPRDIFVTYRDAQNSPGKIRMPMRFTEPREIEIDPPELLE